MIELKDFVFEIGGMCQFCSRHNVDCPIEPIDPVVSCVEFIQKGSK